MTAMLYFAICRKTFWPHRTRYLPKWNPLLFRTTAITLLLLETDMSSFGIWKRPQLLTWVKLVPMMFVY